MNEFLKGILDWINIGFNNYGWSVVIFTLLIRLVCFPFDYKSRVSMRKTTKLQPQLTALQKKYANDKDKLNLKMSELYKKEHINPLSSCLPMLITLPLLYAMFAAMRMVANENLVQQAFDILQGNTPAAQNWLWIHNIWMPDSPFAASLPDLNSLRMIPADIWQNAISALGDGGAALSASTGITFDFSSANLSATIQSIYDAMEAMPAYAQGTSVLNGLSFNFLGLWQLSIPMSYNGYFILPILAAATQFLMTILQPGQPAAPAEGQPNTGAFMKWFFPLFSLFICAGYTACFSIYWVTSNVIAAVQNVGINWYLDAKEKKAETIGEGTVK